MIKKSLIHVMTTVLIVIALTACGGRGVDRKLNVSGNQIELVKSYGEAMVEATPEQQKILRERDITGYVLALALHSNPSLIQLYDAKSAETLERVRKMSVREISVWILTERQNELNIIVPALEKFQSGQALKVENISIDDVNPKDITPYTSSVDIDGVLLFRNTSDDFDFDFRGCQLALVFDGKAIEKLRESNDCKENKVIKSKGGKDSIKFSHRINGNENIKTFHDFLKDGQMEKIAWSYKNSNGSYIRSNSDPALIVETDDSKFERYKEELQQVTADLAVMKK